MEINSSRNVTIKYILLTQNSKIKSYGLNCSLWKANQSEADNLSMTKPNRAKMKDTV